MKIVVFDLDETLGYFTQLGILWDCMKECALQNNVSLSQNDFNQLLDQCQEFLRPKIIKILYYLKKKKESKCCSKILIYTNNSGKREWCERIIKYFHFKLNYNLFDQIIAAFKINGKIIELCRSTHEKTHMDFLKCARIPPNSEICFLDDRYHQYMNTKQIYYIQLKPYFCDIDWEIIHERIPYSILPTCMIGKKFREELSNKINSYKYIPKCKDKEDLKIDNCISKDIYKHLVIFFNDRKTKKNKLYSSNKTSRFR